MSVNISGEKSSKNNPGLYQYLFDGGHIGFLRDKHYDGILIWTNDNLEQIS